MKSGKFVNLYAGAIVAATLGLSGSVFAQSPPPNKAPTEAKKVDSEKPATVKPVQANPGAAKAEAAKPSLVKPTQANEGAAKAAEARTKREKPEDEIAEGEDAKAPRRAAPGHLFKKMSKAEKKAYQTRLKELNRERRNSRNERSEKDREKLKLALGAAEPSPAIQAELRSHAWRVARLSRLLEMAQARELEEPIARIQELQKKEDERHVKHLAVLKAQGPGPAKTGAAQPEAAKTGAAQREAAKTGAVKADAAKADVAQKKESM